jgi:hypothetical protein
MDRFPSYLPIAKQGDYLRRHGSPKAYQSRQQLAQQLAR